MCVCVCVCVCAVHAGENANVLTLPEQGDKIFDSSEYNGFWSISSFSMHRHFSICCSIRRLLFPTYLKLFQLNES